MARVLVAALVLMVMSGCAGVSQQVDENSANISILDNRTNNLKSDIGELRAQVDKLIIQVTGLNEKVEAVAASRPAPTPAEAKKADKAAPDTQKLSSEIMLLEQELSIIESRLNKLEQAKKGQPVAAAAAAKQTPSIKVLSSRDLKEAREMAAFLIRNGFQVKAVDQSKTETAKYDTVYFTQGYEGYAQQIAEVLGGKTMLKPLSWSSSFSIIVIKGEEK